MATATKAVIEVKSKAEWDEYLLKAANGGQTVLVDFTATWCGPCRMIGPIFAELAEKYKETLVFLKVDVDGVPEVAEVSGISAMPTFQVYQGGQKVDELVGASKEKLTSLVEKYLK